MEVGMMAEAMVGTSGWAYEHWRGTFYPDDLPQREWLAFYASRFDTVEVNNSFYRLPRRETFEAWKDEAPAGFRFTVKASRYITHRKKLREPERGVGNFYENLTGLGDSCACVLFQLPPRWNANLGRLGEFLKVLDEQTAKFAKGSGTFAKNGPRYRIAFEFRDESWLTYDTYGLLAAHNAALVAADSPFYPAPDERTADFDFFRMHGGHHRVRPGYTNQEIAALAGKVASRLSDGRDVFVYFNNDYAGYAVKNAQHLLDLLSERKGGGGAGTAGR